MSKMAMPERKASARTIDEDTWLGYSTRGIEHKGISLSKFIFFVKLYSKKHIDVNEEAKNWLDKHRSLWIDERQDIFKTFLSFFQLREEAKQEIKTLLESRKGELQKDKEPKWPEYISEEFEKIAYNSKGLEDAGEDKSQILYTIMEIEALLGKVEKKARATNRKYESRLAASLRDLCRVNEPKNLTKEQIKTFRACLTAMIEGWGVLNKEKVRWIRYQLLDVGLTWLPITDKAVKDVLEAQKAKK